MHGGDRVGAQAHGLERGVAAVADPGQGGVDQAIRRVEQDDALVVRGDLELTDHGADVGQAGAQLAELVLLALALVALTAATQPSIEDVLLGAIPGLPKVHLHNPVLAYEVGDDFMKFWYQAWEGKLDPFVLVVEGSIPNEKIK